MLGSALARISICRSDRLGWVRDFSYAQQQPYSLKQYAGDFVPGIPLNPAIGGGIPLTQFSNFGFEGSPDFLPKQQVPPRKGRTACRTSIRQREP